MTKKEKRQSIISLIMTSVALVFAIVSISYSWYTITENTKVDEMSFRTEYVLNVRFKDTENTSKVLTKGLPDNFQMGLITGNGYNFYEYASESKTFIRDVDSSFYGIDYPDYESVKNHFTSLFKELDEDSLKEKAIVKEFGIKSNTEAGIKINSNSKIAAVFSDTFSNSTAASMRLALLEKDISDVYRLKMFWFPNARTRVTFDSQSGKYSLSKGDLDDHYYFFNIQGENMPDDLTPNDEENETYVISQESTYYKDPVSNVLFVWGDFNNNMPYVSTIEKEKEYKIIIWIEGNDTEANSYFGAESSMGFKGKIDIDIILEAESLKNEE